MKIIITIFISFFIAVLFFSCPVSAVDKLYQAVIIQKNDKALVVTIEEQGRYVGRQIPVETYGSSTNQYSRLEEGDKVLISLITSKGKGQELRALIVDKVRLQPLLILFGLFLLFVIGVGKWKGFFAFGGMLFSFLIIANLIVPQIVLGNNPILVTLIGAFCIIPLSFVLAHGFTWRTTVSIISTFLTLAITGILAVIFVDAASLTGFANEEAQFIRTGGLNIDIRQLLLAGILIGAMGVLDDITISQSAIVEKIAKHNPSLSSVKLFREAMDVGRDHIASLVNTLILVYTGAALPLFVLFYQSPYGLMKVVNMESVATEIVRTLVSSIGIIAAVPLTTVLAIMYAKKTY